MISPKYDDELDVQYILVHTNYNNRALSNKLCCKIMTDVMNDFSEYTLGGSDLDEEFDTEDLTKLGSVYHIPPAQLIKLLYTVHNGYTWIDADTSQKKVYINCDGTDDEVSMVREKFKAHDLDDTGCFVFELVKKTKVNFRDVLFKFVSELTKMEFCGFFCMDTLYSIKYCEEANAILFTFDTESG